MMFPLGDMPQFQFTEEMRKKAFQDAIRQAGIGMMAASLNGARTGEALGQGMLGGFQSYQQAPQLAQKQFNSQLDAQKEWLGMNKTAAELQKLGREEQQAAKQQDFLSMLTNPGRASMAVGGGPSLANFNTGQNYQNNPAAMLADPRINIQALAAGVDPSKLGSALQNTRPFQMDQGKTYQYADGTERYMPQIPVGMTFDRNGRVVNAEGFTDALYNQEQTKGMAGVLPAQMIQGFALDNAPITDVNTGRPMRAGSVNPVIGLPGRGLPPQGQGASSPVQVALTPAQQASQANLTSGNELWRTKTLAPVLETEGVAREALAQTNALRNVDLNTGFGTETIAAIAAPFAALGWQPAKEYKSATEMFRAIGNDQTLTKQMIQRGIATEKDTLLVKQTLAQLGNTPQANQFIMDFSEALSKAQIRKAEFYSAAHNRALETGEKNLSRIDQTWRRYNNSLWSDPIMQKWIRK